MCGFPKSLPVCLHAPADPDERLRWMAEIDLDPASDAKIVVCSAHFVDGRPTPGRNPNPSLMLREGEGRETFEVKTEEQKETKATKKEATAFVQIVMKRTKKVRR